MEQTHFVKHGGVHQRNGSSVQNLALYMGVMAAVDHFK